MILANLGLKLKMRRIFKRVLTIPLNKLMVKQIPEFMGQKNLNK